MISRPGPLHKTDPLGLCYESAEGVIQCLTRAGIELDAALKPLEALLQSENTIYVDAENNLNNQITRYFKTPQHELPGGPSGELDDSVWAFHIHQQAVAIEDNYTQAVGRIIQDGGEAFQEYLDKIKKCKLCDKCKK